MNATISRKQAGVIFGAWKRGEIEAEKTAIDLMYARFVGEPEQTSDSVTGDLVLKLKSTIDSVFASDGEATAKFKGFVDAYKRSYDDKLFAL